jgi:hypothetical protein
VERRIKVAHNFKRGFNRLFVVLTVVWALYCLVVYPMQQRRKAQSHYTADSQSCYETELKESKPKFDACLKTAKEEWQTSVDQWSVKNFYIGQWPLLLAAIVGLPLLLYGCLRGIATVSLWVWRGFKTPA